ncbi:neuroglian-like isoform X2 [Pomacea canaliculata]|uniref:neuroglian-like isoform X2 n=1 Tax=Pomacea canaliculata TaxID=400727 RepID=UPI000D728331|nr:neuroglian-like isoform X2 [Pomacea canaliculata]XP_025102637.1 neuroglian-like isoform X2 [Pomacea canaliculata]
MHHTVKSCRPPDERVLLCLEARATDLEVEEGSRVRLLCKTSSDLLDRSHLQVRWYQNGRELNMNVTQSNKIIKNINNKKYSQKADKTRFTLVIRNAQLEDAGLYTCEGYYANGSVLWTTTSLAVKGRPGPPTSVEVRSCHGNRAELAWRAAPPNGAKIREYSLEFNTSEEPDVWYPYYERIPGDRHEFFVDLPPYGIYTFRLLARNDIGDSQPSDVTRRSCTTPPDKPDRSPKQVVTRTHKKGYLVIEWTLQYWKSSEGRRKMQEVDITVTPDTVERHPVVRATLAGLPANIALRGQVAVRNTHYTGPPSKTIDFFTPEGTPSAVLSLPTVEVEEDYVLLSREPPVEPNGCLTDFEIGYQPVEGAQLGPVRNLKPKIDDPETLQAKITGLEPANNYRLVVSARTSSGRGKGSPVPVYMVVLPVVAGLTLIAVAVTVLLKLKRTKKQEENMNMKWKQVITSDV